MTELVGEAVPSGRAADSRESGNELSDDDPIRAPPRRIGKPALARHTNTSNFIEGI